MSNNNTRLHISPHIIDVSDGDLTPELKSRVISAELKQQAKKAEHEINDEWRCCCFKERTDARLIKYSTQIAILVGVIILCIVRLSDPTISCANSNTYVSILSLCLGIICPSPKLN